MGAFADLLQEMADLVEAVSGLTRIKVPGNGDQMAAQALGGGFVITFDGGTDTGEERGRHRVIDEHDCTVDLWYLIDHNDQLTTQKTALDDVIAVRNALYPPSRDLTAASPTSFAWAFDNEAGGEVMHVAISTTLKHITAVS